MPFGNICRVLSCFVIARVVATSSAYDPLAASCFFFGLSWRPTVTAQHAGLLVYGLLLGYAFAKVCSYRPHRIGLAVPLSC